MSKKIVIIGFIIWAVYVLNRYSYDSEIASYHPYPESLQSSQRAMITAFTKLSIGLVITGAIYLLMKDKKEDKG